MVVILKYMFIFLLFTESSYAYEQFPNILFDFDKATVDKSALNTLNIDASRIGPSDVIWVKGYTDPVGNESYNKSLSRKRAEFLRQLVMIKYNLSDSQVRLTEFGEDQRPGIPNSEKRRVEVIVGDIKEIKILMEEKEPPAHYGGKSYSFHKDLSHKSSRQEDEPLEKSFNVAEPEKGQYQEKYSQSPRKSSALNIRYTLGGGSYYNVLSATDKETNSQAEWISKENYNFEGVFQWNWGSFWLGVQMALHVQDYLQPDTESAFLWDEEAPQLLKFSFTSDYESFWWSLGWDIDYNQVPYIYEDSSNIELKDVFMLGTSLRTQARWFQWNQWSSRLGVKLILPIIGFDDIESKGELGYTGFIDLRREKVLGGMGLHLKLYYGLRNYINNQNNQEDTMAGFIFSVTSPDWM